MVTNSYIYKTTLCRFFLNEKLQICPLLQSQCSVQNRLDHAGVMMAAKWTSHRKQEWEGKGTVTCKTSLTLADQARDKAKEQETEETHLKLLESGMGHTGKHSQSSTH